MTRSRRPPRRQGVVYGPSQDRDQGYEATSLIGRILGMLVVAAAVGVLAVGAMTFLGRSDDAPPPAASATASAAANQTLPASPRPTAALPTTLPTPGASAPASPSAAPVSPGASAGATPFQLAVLEGPGFVTFGTENNSSLRITDARTSFELGERITWSANLTEPANSVDLRIEISRLDPATGAEEPVREDSVRPRVSGAQVFLRRIRPGEALDGAGIYVVRYIRGTTVMAEGFFEVRGG